MARHRFRPRKRLGQNFLVDPVLRDRVVETAGVLPSDEVLEVGAGAGTLTVRLASRCRRLVAVELDQRLLPILREATAGLEVELVAGDILALQLERFFPAGSQVVVGNIPYYLTGALVQRLLEPSPRPRLLSLVVQKEVAERWTAPGGWSLATVAVQVFAEPELQFLLPAEAFQPRPNVDSALVRLQVRASPLVPVAELSGFFALVEQVFQFRRKQLSASLGRISRAGSAAAAERLSSVGVEPSRRPETLSVAEWRAVHTAFRG
jgi:16S rRNA (adenine1518-N6/adenine1519-N6)-dimethyltransferase